MQDQELEGFGCSPAKGVFNTYLKESSRRSWKKIYGFKYSYTIPGFGNKNKTDISACIRKCLKLESSKFAKDCRKKGGVFKCCVADWKLNVYEATRLRLVGAGLVNGSTTMKCKPNAENDPCHVCTLDSICTTRDSLTGLAHQSFYKGIKKQHQVGGEHEQALNPIQHWISF